MSSQPTLTTERLILRPFTLDDAKDVTRLAGTKEVADTTYAIPHPYPHEAAIEWISTHQANFGSGESVVYAVTLKENNSLIGTVSLIVNKPCQRGELGYWLDPQEWNKGYITEAAKELLRFGFEEWNLHKIYASHMTRNLASGKVMQKLGMEREGMRKEHTFRWGKFEDTVLYGILKKEWEEMQ